MRKNLTKIKISLLRSVEKLKSRKRYFCLFVCLGVFISEIELPRIPTYFLKPLFLYTVNIIITIAYRTQAKPAIIAGTIPNNK